MIINSVLPKYVPYKIPSDWMDISTVTSNTIKLLVSDMGVATYAFKVTTSSGTFSVDWGDGQTSNLLASNTTAQHTYSIGTGTACSRGYTQFVITITATGNITRFNMVLHTVTKNNQEHGYLGANFGTTALTSFANAFYTANTFCKSLEFCMFPSSLAACTTTASAFQNCDSLKSITNLTAFTNVGASAGTSVSMFQGCYELQSVDLSGFIITATATSMFNGCTSLRVVRGLGSMVALTSAATMFNACISLESIDGLSSLTALVTATSMFNGCTKLSKTPSMTGLTHLADASSMFLNCVLLTTTPDLSTLTALTTTASMFSGCQSIEKVDTFSGNYTTLATTFSMFLGCTFLRTVTNMTGLGAVTNSSSMFSGCTYLQSVSSVASMVNVAGTTNVTGASNMFTGCLLLSNVDGLSSLGSSAANTYGVTMFSTNELMTTIDLSGAKLSAIGMTGANNKLNAITSFLYNSASLFGYATSPQINLNYCSFSAVTLNTIFTNLPVLVGKTISITGCLGQTIVNHSGCTTTSGSATVVCTNTGAGITAGREISGVGVSTAVAVTTQGAGDTVTRVAHGQINGDIVYFATLVTTTGIAISTTYYVVNKTADTFQLSLTNGGSVIDLVGDGSGTITRAVTIVSFVVNTSITLSLPASANGSALTLVSTTTKPSLGVGRGWTVTN